MTASLRFRPSRRANKQRSILGDHEKKRLLCAEAGQPPFVLCGSALQPATALSRGCPRVPLPLSLPHNRSGCTTDHLRAPAALPTLVPDEGSTEELRSDGSAQGFGVSNHRPPAL